MKKLGGLHGLFQELITYDDASVYIKVGVRVENVEARMVQIMKNLI